MVVYKALSCLQINVVIYPALHLLEQLPTDKSRNAQICTHARTHTVYKYSSTLKHVLHDFACYGANKSFPKKSR